MWGRRLGSLGFLGIIYVTFQCGGGGQSPNRCEIRADGTRTIDVSIDRGTLRLEVDATKGTSTMSILIDGKERFRRRSWTEGEVGRQSAWFIDESGARHEADLSVRGETLDGTIDGRRLVSFRKGSPYDGLSFDDGSIAPTFPWAPPARDLVERLNKLASEQDCSAPAAPTDDGIGTKGLPAGPESPGNSGACFLCHIGCGGAFTTCEFGCLTGCLPFPWPANLVCFGFCSAGCGFTLAACVGACTQAGGPCCPVPCGLGCCNSGSKCVVPSIVPNTPHFCCPFQTSECAIPGTINCCFGTETCNKATAACCLNPGEPCGSKCCPTSTPKCADVPSELCCVSSETLCTGVNASTRCCAPTRCAPKTNNCCPGSQVICNGVCCAPGELCFGGAVPQCTPCPVAQQCGTKCCPGTQACTNPATETCCDLGNACGGSCCIPGTTTCTTFPSTQCCPNDRLCGNWCCSPAQACVALNVCM